MRNLDHYVEECMFELSAIGIKGSGLPVVPIVNTRAKKRWGLCRKTPDGFVIEINSILLDERNSESGLKETILHELIHTIPGCMNHGEKWKSIAEKVNRAYGYNIKRTNSAGDKGICGEMITAAMPNYIYRVDCVECGYSYKRTKMSKLIQNPGRYRCGRCGGKLERISNS